MMEQAQPVRKRAPSISTMAALALVITGAIAARGDPEAVALLVVALVLLGGIAYALMGRHRATYRVAVGIALAAAFILFWMVGAVGVLGSDDQHPADLLYVGVLAVGVVGAIAARFEARGMARAMFAAATAQLLVPFVGLAIYMPASQVASNLPGIIATLILNAFFAGLLVGSGLLFHRAARVRRAA